MTENTELKFKEKEIRIVWGSDENIPALYANHLFISHVGEFEFHLIFGHLSPPLALGLHEGELPDYVQIKPVAKIVISPEAMKKFVEAIDDNLNKFIEKQKGK